MKHLLIAILLPKGRKGAAGSPPWARHTSAPDGALHGWGGGSGCLGPWICLSWGKEKPLILSKSEVAFRHKAVYNEDEGTKRSCKQGRDGRNTPPPVYGERAPYTTATAALSSIIIPFSAYENKLGGNGFLGLCRFAAPRMGKSRTRRPFCCLAAKPRGPS